MLMTLINYMSSNFPLRFDIWDLFLYVAPCNGLLHVGDGAQYTADQTRYTWVNAFSLQVHLPNTQDLHL